MIGYLEGTIKHIHPDYLLIVVNGVGYRVSVPAGAVEGTMVGKDVSLYTHQHIREDSLALYGFSALTELELFEKLIGVSGIGPKAGLALLSTFSADQIRDSIITSDTSLLTKVSGIGKKTAERLILELKGSLADGTELGDVSTSTGTAIQALEQLGYSSYEAMEIVKTIDRNLPVEEQVKLALKELGQQR